MKIITSKNWKKLADRYTDEQPYPLGQQVECEDCGLVQLVPSLNQEQASDGQMAPGCKKCGGRLMLLDDGEGPQNDNLINYNNPPESYKPKSTFPGREGSTNKKMIIKSKKYADSFENRDPYKVDFVEEEEKAKRMSTESLLMNLKDAISATQKSVNEGKYFDQASVYRKELTNRGISIQEQNSRLRNTPTVEQYVRQVSQKDNPPGRLAKSTNKKMVIESKKNKKLADKMRGSHELLPYPPDHSTSSLGDSDSSRYDPRVEMERIILNFFKKLNGKKIDEIDAERQIYSLVIDDIGFAGYDPLKIMQDSIDAMKKRETLMMTGLAGQPALVLNEGVRFKGN